ncbi:MAG: L-2-hydroxyglutarate oxidase [Methylotetracoccus sp.]
MTIATTDFLIIGGGVIGFNLALTAKQRHPDSRVTLIEKEPQAGLHASGRNSGVLHAGFYYTADSLKAKFCRDGNRELSAYCDQHDIPLNRCGKLVVARNAAEVETLGELLRRGRTNGVELQEISADEAREIEPRVKTFERALWSPTTASVDPKRVMAALVDDAVRLGIDVRSSTAYIARTPEGIRTSGGTIQAGYVINAAGLYADHIARDFGFSQNYSIIPFKGLYLYSDEPPGSVRTNIYPVPDLRNPFLGVHFTINAEGRTKLGPTAIPAFWREHYKGLTNFQISEMWEIVLRELGLFLRNDFGFRRLAVEELAKYSRTRMARLASELATGVRASDYRHWGPPGIRAQLYDLKARRLDMDFRFEGDQSSFHVLNAVSPAFTCAIPFARYLFEQIDALAGGRSSPLATETNAA